MEKRCYSILSLDLREAMKIERLRSLLDAITPIPETDNYCAVILMIPARIYSHIKKIDFRDLFNYLNNPEFINSIYTHCFLVCDGSVCEIHNITKRALPFMKSIVRTVKDSGNTTFWVNTDPKDPSLAKKLAAHMFHNPVVSKDSPLGANLGREFLCMVRHGNRTIITDESQAEVDNVLHQHNLRNMHCSMVARLTENTISYLKELPKNSRNEIAGALRVGSSSKNRSAIIYDIVVDKSSVVEGEKEGVEVVNRGYNFHTHPVDAYVRNGYKYAWPSVHDYTGFLKAVKMSESLFHVVVGVEGVYIISVAQSSLNSITSVSKEKVSKLYRCDRKMVKTPQQYLSHINRIGIFHVDFLPWVKARKPFVVYFPKSEGKCVVPKA